MLCPLTLLPCDATTMFRPARATAAPEESARSWDSATVSCDREGGRDGWCGGWEGWKGLEGWKQGEERDKYLVNGTLFVSDFDDVQTQSCQRGGAAGPPSYPPTLHSLPPFLPPSRLRFDTHLRQRPADIADLLVILIGRVGNGAAHCAGERHDPCRPGWPRGGGREARC